MPARAPRPGTAATRALRAVGAQLRARRKLLGLSAVATAEAAGLSRVTVHRIEKGEPSVAMGAYVSLIDALGLGLELRDPKSQKGPGQASTHLPRAVRLADYPELKKLAWQLQGKQELSPAEALELYERNWRHVNPPKLGKTERELIDRLLTAFGRERLLV